MLNSYSDEPTGVLQTDFVKNEIASIQFPETDLTGLATETYVGEAIAAADISSKLENYEKEFLKYTYNFYDYNKVENKYNEVIGWLGESSSERFIGNLSRLK